MSKAAFRLAAMILGLAAGCGGTHGKVVVDTTVPGGGHLIPYEKPDISEITGIDEETPDSDAGSATGSASADAGK